MANFLQNAVELGQHDDSFVDSENYYSGAELEGEDQESE